MTESVLQHCSTGQEMETHSEDSFHTSLKDLEYKYRTSCQVVKRNHNLCLRTEPRRFITVKHMHSYKLKEIPSHTPPTSLTVSGGTQLKPVYFPTSLSLCGGGFGEWSRSMGKMTGVQTSEHLQGPVERINDGYSTHTLLNNLYDMYVMNLRLYQNVLRMSTLFTL